jgi:hypothetical protein
MFSPALCRCALASLLPLWTGLACSRAEPPPAPAPAPSASAPVDRLEPNEIPEGTLLAFGLKLPRGMTLAYQGPDEVHAVGGLAPERVANYVRKHVQVEAVELGAARTVFDRARVLGDATGRPVRIEVMHYDHGTKMVVRNLAPPKVLDPELSPEDRWRKFGLDPNGNIIDPTQL